MSKLFSAAGLFSSNSGSQLKQTLLLGMLGALTACGSAGQSAEEKTLPPTGHYEGAVGLPGTGVRVGLELRRTRAGELQAELMVPGTPVTTIPMGTVRYQAPQLQISQIGGFPGTLSISALREGDFLRGVLQLDSIRGEFVWVRRGEAAPRPFREQAVRLPGLGVATLYLPVDTLATHPVVVSWAPTTSPNLDRVMRLGKAGWATLLLAPAAAGTDSVVARQTVVALRWLRGRPEADTTRLGVWTVGSTAAEAAVGASQGKAAFLVVEQAALTEETMLAPFRQLARLRIPVFGLYAGRDTALNVRESSQRLRRALGGRRGMQVRVFAQAKPNFLVPGNTAADGQWQWPRPTPGFWEGLERWLKQLN
ncbi:hypothetical protein HER32_08055 [Hymenobacter sp. BT18]|uniref:hypothetical protein n=1 Tax=Hymenobacter sp. BT18 TaxID=2835648 RepID=UPI00143E8504|nr:hypothetical protein [Hymenobacter sp. BT18]QIX61134.1 hypothetical protein HER32_08055 [Hymenobacter sp. BT18]